MFASIDLFWCFVIGAIPMVYSISLPNAFIPDTYLNVSSGNIVISRGHFTSQSHLMHPFVISMESFNF